MTTFLANQTIEGPVAGGAAGGNPVLVGVIDGSGNTQPLSGDSSGLAHVNGAVTLLASGVVTAAGTVNATAVTGLGKYKQLLVLLSVTAAATDAADTLDVYVDTSPDGGTTWVNAIHFNQILGNGGAKKFWAVLDPAGAAGTSVIAATSDAAAATVRPSMFCDYVRVRHVVVDGGGHAQSFTFAVLAYAKG